MATIVEQRSQPLGGYDYDHMRLPGPQFTNPWGTTTTTQQQQHHQHQQQQQPQHHYYGSTQQPTSVSHDSFSTRPQFTSGSLPAPILDQTQQTRSYTDFASTAPTSAPGYTSTASADRISEVYSNAYTSPFESRLPLQYQTQTASRAARPTFAGRDSFSDALDAGHGMIAMSQQDFTPRGAYPPRNGSTDSYGFPSGSEHGSSISSGSSYPYYGSYSGSVDGSVAGSSVTDYSSASEDIGQRTLPPPGHLISGYPPDATQMMTQFNSKLAQSAQKKHKCKICDKRFTRPSSLQTHMYSHTGEKPFACDFEGCGRHFSVVSNLRRHKKCHKGDGSVDSASPEE